jgi:hypothetical protein
MRDRDAGQHGRQQLHHRDGPHPTGLAVGKGDRAGMGPADEGGGLADGKFLHGLAPKDHRGHHK